MRSIYNKWEHAANAAWAFGIKIAREYGLRRSEGPKLPSNPHKYSKEKWEENGGWHGFLNNKAEKVSDPE